MSQWAMIMVTKLQQKLLEVYYPESALWRGLKNQRPFMGEKRRG